MSKTIQLWIISGWLLGCSSSPHPSEALDATGDLALDAGGDQAPNPLDINASCQPGQRRWCDGLEYDGWGQALCDPQTGTWNKVMINGQPALNCQTSLGMGHVPDTPAGCYYWYFNPAACERPDCIVPEGTQGKICPKSTNQLCDYCNPKVSECAEEKAICVFQEHSLAFCGRDCANQDCPEGYVCSDVTDVDKQTFKQCVPRDKHCWEVTP